MSTLTRKLTYELTYESTGAIFTYLTGEPFAIPGWISPTEKAELMRCMLLARSIPVHPHDTEIGFVMLVELPERGIEVIYEVILGDKVGIIPWDAKAEAAFEDVCNRCSVMPVLVSA